MEKWTVAKWSGDRPMSVVSGAETGRAVAVAIRPSFISDEEWEPIARLIAAAPEMVKIVRLVAHVGMEVGEWGERIRISTEDVDKARALLARIEDKT